MLNHIVIMGRLVRDPELRRTQAGVPVSSFSIAVDRDYKPENGERETDFVDIVAWRSTAEFVQKYFGKGRMAVVSGRLQMRNWTDNQGNKRTTAEVVADNVYVGDSKRDNDNSGFYNGNSYAAPNGGHSATAAPAVTTASDFATLAVTTASDFAILEEDDSELPF